MTQLFVEYNCKQSKYDKTFGIKLPITRNKLWIKKNEKQIVNENLKLLLKSLHSLSDYSLFPHLISNLKKQQTNYLFCQFKIHSW